MSDSVNVFSIDLKNAVNNKFWSYYFNFGIYYDIIDINCKDFDTAFENRIPYLYECMILYKSSFLLLNSKIVGAVIFMIGFVNCLFVLFKFKCVKNRNVYYNGKKN